MVIRHREDRGLMEGVQGRTLPRLMRGLAAVGIYDGLGDCSTHVLRRRIRKVGTVGSACHEGMVPTTRSSASPLLVEDFSAPKGWPARPRWLDIGPQIPGRMQIAAGLARGWNGEGVKARHDVVFDMAQSNEPLCFVEKASVLLLWFVEELHIVSD